MLGRLLGYGGNLVLDLRGLLIVVDIGERLTAQVHGGG